MQKLENLFNTLYYNLFDELKKTIEKAKVEKEEYSYEDADIPTAPMIDTNELKKLICVNEENAKTLETVMPFIHLSDNLVDSYKKFYILSDILKCMRDEEIDMHFYNVDDVYDVVNATLNTVSDLSSCYTTLLDKPIFAKTEL